MNFKPSDIVLLHGDPAVATFEMLEHLFVDLKPELEKAKLYARSSSPVLIEASAGPELEMIGQAIHNGSDRKGKSYAVISLSGLTNEDQNRILFGDPRMGREGAIMDCNHGTLMIQGIDKLTLPMQSQLARVIRTKRVASQTNFSQYRYVDIRIIGTTSKNLTELRNQFLFRSDLLFTFRALRLRIPKLKNRPHDVENMLDFYFNDYNREYGMHHTLTAHARETIIHYSWDSNIMQLNAFCERLVLTAPDVQIHTGYVQALLAELYEQDSAIYAAETKEHPVEDSLEHHRAISQKQMAWMSAEDSPERRRALHFSSLSEVDSLPSGTDPLDPSTLLPHTPESNDIYRDLLVACLRKNGGNRKKTAQELGISTTTLWRKIRYYHLE